MPVANCRKLFATLRAKTRAKRQASEELVKSKGLAAIGLSKPRTESREASVTSGSAAGGGGAEPRELTSGARLFGRTVLGEMKVGRQGQEGRESPLQCRQLTTDPYPPPLQRKMADSKVVVATNAKNATPFGKPREGPRSCFFLEWQGGESSISHPLLPPPTS